MGQGLSKEEHNDPNVKKAAGDASMLADRRRERQLLMDAYAKDPVYGPLLKKITDQEELKGVEPAVVVHPVKKSDLQ